MAMTPDDEERAAFFNAEPQLDEYAVSPAAAAGPAEVFERYRRAINAALRASLVGRDLPFYDMQRYHLGLDDPSADGGKALRPTLLLLVCDALRGTWMKALPAAAAIELIHNFSLIHDDIQDQDRERRHRPTVWTKWGIPQGINAGDAMFCLATLALGGLRESFDDSLVLEALLTLQQATGEMIEGQYLDVYYESCAEVALDDYLAMIGCKTGALLRASVELGALLADAGTPARLRSRRLGEAIGRLFQIRDDMLGVWGRSETTGKPVDSDIRRRKKSLPVVMALSMAGEAERSELLRIYAQSELSDADVSRVQEIFAALEVQAHIRTLANECYDQAVALTDAINFSDRGRQEVLHVIDFLLHREY